MWLKLYQILFNYTSKKVRKFLTFSESVTKIQKTGQNVITSTFNLLNSIVKRSLINYYFFIFAIYNNLETKAIMIKYFFKTLVSHYNKKYDRMINRSLFELNKNDSNFSLKFVDVGAAGDIHPRWKRISKFLDYIGFEPDKRSSELLVKSQNCKSYKIYPYALWNKKQKLKFNLTKKPEVSSAFKPNYKFLNQFMNSERFKIESIIELDSIDLDNLEIEGIDFIKMDVQGGELNIISGAENNLPKCIGLELEVEFNEIYENQPLFGDLQEKLSNYGFEFIDFVSLDRWERDDFNSFGQCVFGDALFLKSPEHMFLEQN